MRRLKRAFITYNYQGLTGWGMGLLMLVYALLNPDIHCPWWGYAIILMSWRILIVFINFIYPPPDDIK